MQGPRTASSRITRTVELLCGCRIGEYLHWIPKSGNALLHAVLANCELAHNALGRIALWLLIGEYLHWIPKSASALRNAGLANCELAHNGLGRVSLRVTDRGVSALETQLIQRFPPCRARDLRARA
jgi:hypothetical protein